MGDILNSLHYYLLLSQMLHCLRHVNLEETKYRLKGWIMGQDNVGSQLDTGTI